MSRPGSVLSTALLILIATTAIAFARQQEGRAVPPSGADARTDVAAYTSHRHLRGLVVRGAHAAPVARRSLPDRRATALTPATMPAGGRIAVPAADPNRPCAEHAPPPAYKHVVVIVEENHDYSAIARHSPYLNRLGRQCTLLTQHRNLTHPSLPNYMALTGGQTYFNGSDCSPTHRCRTNARSIFSQLGPNGWKVYAESMPRNCYHANAGAYAPRHTAAPYYTRIATACKSRDVPLGTPQRGALTTDLARGQLPRLALIIPNLRNDEHDGSITQGDAWLAQWVPRLLATPGYTKGRTAIIITYDEGRTRLYTVAASKSVTPNTIVATTTNHYGLLRTIQSMLHLGCLSHTCTAHNLRRPIGL